jgi:hypothetical protein
MRFVRRRFALDPSESNGMLKEGREMLHIISLGLALTIVSAGHTPPEGGELGPGPGNGWGFPNGNPDGYGFWSPGSKLPICSGRSSEYYLQRYFMLPPCQLMLPQYFNPYVMRSQRYIPYTGCGGCHAFSEPIKPTYLSLKPYDNEPADPTPVVRVPRFVGTSEAAPVNSGGSGLLP